MDAHSTKMNEWIEEAVGLLKKVQDQGVTEPSNSCWTLAVDH